MEGGASRVFVVVPDGRCVEATADERTLASVRDEVCGAWPDVVPDLFTGGWLSGSRQWLAVEEKLERLAGQTVLLWTVSEPPASTGALSLDGKSRWRFFEYWTLPCCCWTAVGFARAALEFGKFEVNQAEMDVILSWFFEDLQLVQQQTKDRLEHKALFEKAEGLCSTTEWTPTMMKTVTAVAEEWVARHQARAALPASTAAQAQQMLPAEEQGQGQEDEPTNGQGGHKRQREDSDHDDSRSHEKGRDDGYDPQTHQEPNHGCMFPEGGHLIKPIFKQAHFPFPLTAETVAGWALQGVDMVAWIDLDCDFKIWAQNPLPPNLLVMAVYQHSWSPEKNIDVPAVLDLITRKRLHYMCAPDVPGGTGTALSALLFSFELNRYVPKETRHFYVSSDKSFAGRTMMTRARGTDMTLLNMCKNLDDVVSAVTQARAEGSATLVQSEAGAAAAGGSGVHLHQQQQQQPETGGASDGRMVGSNSKSSGLDTSTTNAQTGSGPGLNVEGGAALTSATGSQAAATAARLQQRLQQLLSSPTSGLRVKKMTVYVRVQKKK